MKYTVASLTVVALLSGNAMAQRKPNIILFLVDDMGWQDTSLPFWKDTTDLNRIYETPNMERLAERGVMFTHAYACSISSPSRVSLFTGANAAQHKVTNWTLKKDTPTDRKDAVLEFEAWNYNGLCPEAGLEHSFYAKCLPQLLRENGYATMMVGKAHFGSMGTPAANPLTIGFDYNIAGHAAGAMGSYLGEEGYGAKSDPERAAVWAVPDLEQYHGTDTFLTEALTLEAKSLLDLKSATKLFSVLLASKRPLITELADKLRLKYPLLPTISPCPTMRLEAIRSIIPISCRRYPKSV